MSALLCRDAGMEARKRDLRTTGGQEEQEREPMERQWGKKPGWRMRRVDELTEYK